jgi:hypothetical protein
MAKFGTLSRGFKPRINEWLDKLEGFLGLPFIAGQWFFVDPTDGAAGNSGLDPTNAVATIKQAYDLCTSGNGDGIALISRGITSAGCTSYLTAALDWTKWGITVVGISAPTRFSQRARVSTAAANLAYLIDVQGSNNVFKNVGFYNGGTTGAGGVLVSGDRNYFENVNFIGGNGMTVPTVNDYSLKLTGAEENTFVDCVIGTDTFNKGDIAGAQLILDRDAGNNGCARNRFIGCEFLAYTNAGTTCGLIKLNSTGDSITRTHIFKECIFHMYRDGAVAAEVNVVIGTDPNNGFIFFYNCMAHGFEDWAPATTARVYVASGAAAAEGGGLTIVAD